MRQTVNLSKFSNHISITVKKMCHRSFHLFTLFLKVRVNEINMQARNL